MSTIVRPGRSRREMLRRRRQVRRRRAAAGALLVAVVVAGWLALLAPKARGPVSSGAPASGVQASRLPAARVPAAPAASKPPAPPAWGLRPAPVGERVALRVGQLKAGLLFDVHTGQVLWELHPDGSRAIASLTKMMTALVVAEHSKPTDRVLITWQATHFAGSGVGLLPLGKRVKELPLLYGLLLPSGNDAAIALAQHVAGSQGRFIAMMNAQARAMGLGCSHFTTVSGLLDKGNYSCPNDLAVLAHAVLAQPLLSRIVATRDAIVPFPIKGGKLFLYNNNPLLRLRFPGADGVKTGYTVASGPCLVAAARRGRAWLAVVLLDSANDYAQAEKLLDAGFRKLGR